MRSAPLQRLERSRHHLRGIDHAGRIESSYSSVAALKPAAEENMSSTPSAALDESAMRKSQRPPSQIARDALARIGAYLPGKSPTVSGSERQESPSVLTSAAISTTRARPISVDVPLATTDLAGFSREDSGTQTLLRLVGAFDALSAPASRSAFETLVNDRRSPVAIDMSAVRLIDSLGVGAIVSLYKRVLAQGGELSVRGLNGQPLAIFQLLRLDRLMAVEHLQAA